MSGPERVVITGMSVNTPLGDSLDGFLDGLMRGRSAISRWRKIDVSRCYSKIGGDLSDFDVRAKLNSLQSRLEPAVWNRARRLIGKVPWATKLSVLMSLDAFLDGGAFGPPIDLDRTAVVVAGHNINSCFQYETMLQYVEEPDYLDPLSGVTCLDTDHAGCVAETLGIRGPIYTLGAACASGNGALRAAVDEVRYHDVDLALVVGAVLDLSPAELHGMCLLGAISFQSFNDVPEQASRPWDVRREGFVPAHGGGALLVESLRSARRRDARIYAEVVGVETNSDANHLPQPSEEGQTRLMTRLLDKCGIAPEQIDYINAHATSTPLGDLTEIRAVKRVFGRHAGRLKLNATKSLLGHTCWAAPVVETVAAVLQMQAGKLHPSINIDELDHEVDLDVCRGTEPVAWPVRVLMKNSFGFGGINSVSILSRFEA